MDVNMSTPKGKFEMDGFSLDRTFFRATTAIIVRHWCAAYKTKFKNKYSKCGYRMEYRILFGFNFEFIIITQIELFYAKPLL